MATNHEAGSSNLSECKSSTGPGYFVFGAAWAWALACGLALLDALWALQALASRPQTENSLVALASLAVWFFLHLPAAALAGAALKAAGHFDGGLGGLAPLTRWTFTVLGSLQTLALARLGLAWLSRPRA